MHAYTIPIGAHTLTPVPLAFLLSCLQESNYLMITLEKFSAIHIGNPELSDMFITVLRQALPRFEALIKDADRVLNSPRMPRSALAGQGNGYIESNPTAHTGAKDAEEKKDLTMEELLTMPYDARPVKDLTRISEQLQRGYSCTLFASMTSKLMLDLAMHSTHQSYTSPRDHETGEKIREEANFNKWFLIVAKKEKGVALPCYVLLQGVVQHLSASDVTSLQETLRLPPPTLLLPYMDA